MATRVDNGPRMTTAELDRLFESVKNWGRWGPDDQRGSLNYITPEQVRAATALVRSGRTASMALEAGTQVAADNPRPALHFMTMMADWGLPSPLGAFCDFVGMEMHGDAHSHIDALCHFLYRGQAYQGMRPDEVTTQGANRFGMG